jgi:hypothetical protein
MSRNRHWSTYSDYALARARYLAPPNAETHRQIPPLRSEPPPPRLEGAADTGVGLLDLGPAQCRYALTDDLPYRFCGKPTANAKEPYCLEHKARCHVGRTSGRELEQMIDSAEAPLAPASNDDRTLGVDEVMRGAARWPASAER